MPADPEPRAQRRELSPERQAKRDELLAIIDKHVGPCIAAGERQTPYQRMMDRPLCRIVAGRVLHCDLASYLQWAADNPYVPPTPPVRDAR